MMLAVAVSMSLAGLVAGPLLVAYGRRAALLRDLVGGLTLGMFPVLVAIRVLPDLFGEIGLLAPLLVMAGFAAFAVVERRSGHAGEIGAALLSPTLAVHSFVDGASLPLAFAARASAGAAVGLAGALVAHRLAEGLFVGSALIPRIGLRATLARVALLGAATLAGVLGGRGLLAHVSQAYLHGLVALGMGAVLHLVIHRHEGPERANRSVTALGVVLGAAGAIFA
jgi:hypothetical protein